MLFVLFEGDSQDYFAYFFRGGLKPFATIAPQFIDKMLECDNRFTDFLGMLTDAQILEFVKFLKPDVLKARYFLIVEAFSTNEIISEFFRDYPYEIYAVQAQLGLDYRDYMAVAFKKEFGFVPGSFGDAGVSSVAVGYDFSHLAKEDFDYLVDLVSELVSMLFSNKDVRSRYASYEFFDCLVKYPFFRQFLLSASVDYWPHKLNRYLYAINVLQTQQMSCPLSEFTSDNIRLTLGNVWSAIPRIRIIAKMDFRLTTTLMLKNIIARLRKLGFLGNIDVLVEDVTYVSLNGASDFSNRQKLGFVFPKEVPGVSFILYDPRSYASLLDIPYAPVTISVADVFGAMGTASIAQDEMVTGVCLRLPVTDISFPRFYYGGMYVTADGDVLGLPVHWRNPLTYTPEELGEVGDVATGPWLTFLNRYHKSADSMVVRGLFRFDHFVSIEMYSFERLMQGLVARCVAQDRPILVFCCDAMRDFAFSAFEKYRDRGVRVFKDGLAIDDIFAVDRACKIAVMFVGNLAHAEFWQLVCASNLPYVAEGVSLSEAIVLGKLVFKYVDYRRSLKDEYHGVYLRLASGFKDTVDRFFSANQALRQPAVPVDAFVAFMCSYSEHERCWIDLVAAARTYLLSTPDALAAALIHVARNSGCLLSEASWKDRELKSIEQKARATGALFTRVGQRKYCLLSRRILALSPHTFADGGPMASLLKVSNLMQLLILFRDAVAYDFRVFDADFLNMLLLKILLVRQDKMRFQDNAMACNLMGDLILRSEEDVLSFHPMQFLFLFIFLYYKRDSSRCADIVPLIHLFRRNENAMSHVPLFIEMIGAILLWGHAVLMKACTSEAVVFASYYAHSHEDKPSALSFSERVYAGSTSELVLLNN